ncbi:MAG: PAS domain S-box protein, partial [Anaerolineae bacterium]
LIARLTEDSERAARLAARVTGAPFVWVEVFDDNGHRILAQRGLVRDGQRGLVDVAQVLSTDADIVDSAAAPSALDAAELGIVSWVMAKLRADDGALIGVLAVADAQPRVWTEAELADIADVAAVLGASISAHLERVRHHQLEQQHRDLLKLIAIGPTVIFRWEYTHQWHISYASPNLQAQFGYDPQDVVNGRIAYRSLVHPDDVERVTQEVQDYLRAGVDSFYQRYRLRHADGTYRYVDDYTMLIRDASGAPQHYYGYIYDVTDRQEAENDLYRSNVRLKSILESDTAYITRTDMEGRFTFVNQHFVALIRRAYQREDSLIGTNSLETVIPEDHQLTLATVMHCIDQPGKPFQVILRKPNPEGSYFHTLWEFAGLVDERGEVSEIQCVGFDITRLMTVTEELSHKEELYRFVFDNTTDSITLHDGQGKLLLGNEAPAFSLGLSPEERRKLTSADYEALVHPDDLPRIEQERARHLQDKAPNVVYTYRLQRPDGSYMWVENRTRYVYAEDGTLRNMIAVRRDITQRVETEEALRRTNALLQSIIDGDSVYIVRTDLDARFTFVNQRFQRLIRIAYPELGDDLIGQDSLDTIAPEDHALTLETVEKCIKTPGKPHQAVLRKRRPAGDFYYTLWEFTGVADADGSVSEIQCVGFDITELVQTQQILSEREQRYRFIFENSLDVISLHAPDGSVLMSNNPQAQVGYSSEEILSLDAEGLSQLIYPEDRPRLHAEQAQHMAEGRASAIYTYRMVRKDGSVFWVENRAQYLRDADGQLTGIITINRDIDERVRAQEALRRNEERYRTLTRMMSDFVFEGGFDEQGRLFIRWLEGDYEGVTGYPMETAAKTWQDTIVEHPDDAPIVNADLRRTLAGDYTSTEFRVLHAQGHYVWVRVARLPIIDPSTGRVTGFYGVVQDINAEKNEAALKAEQERLTTNLRQEQVLNETIRRVVSTISHDIRTPLAVISTSKDMLSRYYDRLSEERRTAAFETIEKQLSYVAKMLDDLGKIVKGTLIEGQLQLSSVNIETLCQVTITELQQSIGQNHILRFKADWQQGAVMIDETLVHRILFNLMSNAIKFSPQGSQITLALAQEQRRIVLAVSDEGIGIPSEDLEKIFDTFYRAENARAIAGTGLGLSIVKECVERHAGTIHVVSQVGRGTTFTVELPLLVEQSQSTLSRMS